MKKAADVVNEIIFGFDGSLYAEKVLKLILAVRRESVTVSWNTWHLFFRTFRSLGSYQYLPDNELLILERSNVQFQHVFEVVQSGLIIQRFEGSLGKACRRLVIGTSMTV